MSILKQLRDAAMGCSNAQYRLALQMVADELSGRIAVLSDDPTAEAMLALNGTWANAVRLLKTLPAEGGNDPTSGSTEPARLAA